LKKATQGAVGKGIPPEGPCDEREHMRNKRKVGRRKRTENTTKSPPKRRRKKEERRISYGGETEKIALREEKIKKYRTTRKGSPDNGIENINWSQNGKTPLQFSTDRCWKRTGRVKKERGE